LHFGSLIAALGSFLVARSQGGRWLVRIEDIDAPRVVPGAAEAILHTLEAYGLHWDGPVLYQSQRVEHYQAALQKLLDAGLAYPCTCSRREIARLAAIGSSGMIYPGICRGGARYPRRPCAMRVRTDSQWVYFKDTIQGDYSQCLETEVGDFVIRRADGFFAYQLAVVVDDAAQHISQIVRGSDLLDSTPRQIYLQKLLGLPIPRYSHLPVAVNSAGDKLSKQTRATPLDNQRPAPALIAALKFLQQQPPAELVRAQPAVILAWALEHWQPERIPAVRTLACAPQLAPPRAAATTFLETNP